MSYTEATLLKYVLSYTGEKEVNDKGLEVPARRRLGSEESSHRGQFHKACAEMFESVETKAKELANAHNAKVEEKSKALKKDSPIGENEQKTEYEAKITNILNGDKELKESAESVKKALELLYEEKYELSVNDKTKAVCKKYFGLFGETVGFVDGDDESVVAINEALA